MRREFLFAFFFSFVALASTWGQQENASPTKVEIRVGSLFKQMTLEEKIMLIGAAEPKGNELLFLWKDEKGTVGLSTFFIAGLLISCASSTSITWERAASRLETGLL